MIRTITLYNGQTGILGPIITGSEEEIANMLAFEHIEGAFDSTKFRINLQTKQLEEITEPRKPLLHELRNKRDDILNTYRWTVMPDSPLSEQNQQEWMTYLKALQSLLKDVTPETTNSVVWPEKPQYQYA
jgi:Phage tail assembly chaperone protein